jgi:NADPH:quinone reductase-like Zn-dependent oxidoreductase
MKAIYLERHGPPEVFQERVVDDPALGPRSVKLRVEAAGVNFADLLQRLGLYGHAPKLPYVPGFEVAGEVIDVGPEVTLFSTGDRVAALISAGGYSDTVVVDDLAVKKIPPGISPEEAAAIPVNYLTAWFCLFNCGFLAKDDRVLIHTAAGGVGVAAVQLALDRGAEVFATAGSEAKLRFVEKMGVHLCVSNLQSNWADQIRHAAGPDGIDVVLDSVGGECLQRSYELLSPLGRLVSFGLSKAVSGPRRNWIKTALAWWKTPRFSPLDLIERNVAVSGFHLGLLGSKVEAVTDAFDQILSKVSAGILTPVVSETFPISAAGAAEAHHFMHARRNKGKVVLVRQD